MRNRINSLFDFILILFLTSLAACNNNDSEVGLNQNSDEVIQSASSNFIINYDKTSFKDQGSNFKFPYSFEGDFSVKNVSSLNFSQTTNERALLKILYSDNTSRDYYLTLWKGQYNQNNQWNDKSDYIFLVGVNLRNNDFDVPFDRTPQKATLYISFTGINIDKEVSFETEIDALPKWKEFQKQLGKR